MNDPSTDATNPYAPPVSPTPPPPDMVPRRLPFSLIELWVCLAIISVLAMVLIPATSGHHRYPRHPKARQSVPTSRIPGPAPSHPPMINQGPSRPDL